MIRKAEMKDYLDIARLSGVLGYPISEPREPSRWPRATCSGCSSGSSWSGFHFSRSEHGPDNRPAGTSAPTGRA